MGIEGAGLTPPHNPPMSRAERLLSLLQLLRRHRRLVSGAALAEALGVSLRTLYRDIASLQAQGAAIDGTPGFGYVLQPGFMLPPLMFTPDEVEALVLGSRWASSTGPGCWWPGASCGRRCATSAPTASPR